MIVSTISLNTAIPRNLRFQNANKKPDVSPVKDDLNKNPLKQAEADEAVRYSVSRPVKDNLVSTSLDDILRTPVHATRKIENYSVSSPSWEELLQAQQKLVDARVSKMESIAQIEQQRQQAAYQSTQQRETIQAYKQKAVYDAGNKPVNTAVNKQAETVNEPQNQTLFAEAITVQYEPVPLPGTGAANDKANDTTSKNPAESAVPLMPGDPVELESYLPEQKVNEEMQEKSIERQQQRAQELASLQSREKQDGKSIDYFI